MRAVDAAGPGGPEVGGPSLLPVELPRTWGSDLYPMSGGAEPAPCLGQLYSDAGEWAHPRGRTIPSPYCQCNVDTMTTPLAGLAEVRAARAQLDEREAELIDRARHDGATWAQIATALGLGSRQAAEQRRQRLTAARRALRHDLDRGYSAQIAAMREAVAELGRWISTDRRWDSRFRRAALVRSTVEAAPDAAPGSLYALAVHLRADLEAAGDRLPPPVRAVAARVDSLLSTRH